MAKSPWVFFSNISLKWHAFFSAHSVKLYFNPHDITNIRVQGFEVLFFVVFFSSFFGWEAVLLLVIQFTIKAIYFTNSEKIQIMKENREHVTLCWQSGFCYY